MSKRIRVWGEGTEGLWSFGDTVDIPGSYSEIRPGDAFITRRVKSCDETVYLRMEKSRGYSSIIGILAPTTVVESAQLEAKRTEETRRRAREKATRRRRRKDRKVLNDVVNQMMRDFPGMPYLEAEEIAQHAFAVGSGRVGRSSFIDLEDKIDMAVIAHIRHVHSRYEELLDEGWYREDARAEAGKEISIVYELWKTAPEDQSQPNSPSASPSR